MCGDSKGLNFADKRWLKVNLNLLIEDQNFLTLSDNLEPRIEFDLGVSLTLKWQTINISKFKIQGYSVCQF